MGRLLPAHSHLRALNSTPQFADLSSVFQLAGKTTLSPARHHGASALATRFCLSYHNPRRGDYARLVTFNKDMKDLCMIFCHEELMARLRGERNCPETDP